MTVLTSLPLFRTLLGRHIFFLRDRRSTEREPRPRVQKSNHMKFPNSPDAQLLTNSWPSQRWMPNALSLPFPSIDVLDDWTQNRLLRQQIPSFPPRTKGWAGVVGWNIKILVFLIELVLSVHGPRTWPLKSLLSMHVLVTWASMVL